jgi:hypothetical protein
MVAGSMSAVDGIVARIRRAEGIGLRARATVLGSWSRSGTCKVGDRARAFCQFSSANLTSASAFSSAVGLPACRRQEKGSGQFTGT